jgi:ferredoxin
MATPCIVCEEFCPTSPKAIWAEEVTVPKRESKYKEKGEALAMETVKVQRPHVDPSLCIGCGACEKVCPIVDKPAVYVTNAGETRSKTNVVPQKYWGPHTALSAEVAPGDANQFKFSITSK